MHEVQAVISAYGLAFAMPMVALTMIAWSLGWVMVVVKSGYSPWLLLLAFIPIVNMIAWLWFAYSEWPIQRELRASRSELKRVSPAFSWNTAVQRQ
jgi:hypothetical protein